MFPYNYSLPNSMAGGVGPNLPVAQSQDSDSDDPTVDHGGRGIGTNNLKLSFNGNERTMNLNPLILTNIQGSPYFKVELFGVKTFHEVVDEIYYKVDHLEPWATGSRKTAGRSQTGMCGGVRGVSAGGIVSSAYCLLFKLYTLKLTKKQVVSLINHCDSPYIRGLGFMFLRYTLPASSLWDWFEPYLEDEEEIDVKAGGGKMMTIGEMCRLMLTRLEWFDTRFPRIAVNVEKQIRQYLEERAASNRQWQGMASNQPQSRREENKTEESREKGRDGGGFSVKRERSRSGERHGKDRRDRSRSSDRHNKDRSRDWKRNDRDRERKKSKSRSRSRERHKKSHKRSRSRERYRSRSRDKYRKDRKDKERDYSEELRRFRDDSSRHKKHSRRSRSRSR